MSRVCWLHWLVDWCEWYNEILRVHSGNFLPRLYTFVFLFQSAMSGNPAVVMRLVASAYAMAEKAGAIVRRVLQSGELGIVEKVWLTEWRGGQNAGDWWAVKWSLNVVFINYFSVLNVHRQGPTIYRHWQTGWSSRASVPPCLKASPKSP